MRQHNITKLYRPSAIGVASTMLKFWFPILEYIDIMVVCTIVGCGTLNPEEKARVCPGSQLWQSSRQD